MTLPAAADIPGLFVFPDYFSAEQSGELVDHSFQLYEQLEAMCRETPPMEQAQIPQPAFVRSANHNLASEEYFARAKLIESAERTLRCEYFPHYGEDGHALAYFRGNANLPSFLRAALVEQIRTSLAAVGLSPAKAELIWKLTMNFYREVGGTVAGFPFHVDIPANGVVTMILNVHQAALFQIAKDDRLIDIPLAIGSLLVLSGESRYDWKHRVVPMPARGGARHGVERISLVLGYQ